MRRCAAAALVTSIAACTAPATTAPPATAPPAIARPAIAPPAVAPSATAPSATAPPAAAPSGVSAAPLTASPARTQEGLAGWRRNHDGLEPNASVQDCLGCHEGTSLRAHTSHPVDVDYPATAGRPDASLRTPDEAQRRGARIPGGKVHCLSCHDPGSPWRSHVALPSGASVRAALAGAMAADDQAAAAEARAPAAGESVNTMPLCQACHTYGD